LDGAVLREWRRSRGWDVPEMAGRLRKAAVSGHVPTHDSLITMVRRWERTGLSTERYELLYAKALGISPDDLAAAPARPKASSLTIVGAGEDGDDPVKRREFGFAALGALAGAAGPSLRIPESVSARHVQDLQTVASELWTRDMSVGGSALLREATGYYSAARALLDEASYTSAVGADLQAVTAELAACAGFIAYDAADQATARHLLTESALLAGTNGNALQLARSYALLAMQCSSLAASGGRIGLAREALRFLDYASQVARNEPSPKVHTIIAMRKATASAVLGDEGAVRVNIAAARRELDRGDHPSDPEWAGFVTLTEVIGHEAISWARIGRPQKSAGVLRAVLDGTDLSARNRTVYRAYLAASLDAAGDHSEALSVGLAVLPDLEGSVKSARSVNYLRVLRERVPRDSEFAVRFDAVASAS
jgi:transcriptional regulator with XRE-family HTH domain